MEKKLQSHSTWKRLDDKINTTNQNMVNVIFSAFVFLLGYCKEKGRSFNYKPKLLKLMLWRVGMGINMILLKH